MKSKGYRCVAGSYFAIKVVYSGVCWTAVLVKLKQCTVLLTTS